MSEEPEFEFTGPEVLEFLYDMHSASELALCSFLDYLAIVEIHMSPVLLLTSSVYVASMHI